MLWVLVCKKYVSIWTSFWIFPPVLVTAHVSDCAIELTKAGSRSGKDIIDGTHTWERCSVTISEDILSTKYDLDLRLQSHVDKMASITTLPSKPRESSPFFPPDSYVSRWIIQKVDPNYNVYQRQKWSIKSCIGHKCVCVYGVGCRIVALNSWYFYFLPDTPVRRRPRLVWRRGMKRYGIS